MAVFDEEFRVPEEDENRWEIDGEEDGDELSTRA